jgi:Xaa-Pro aminopeptidase
LKVLKGPTASLIKKREYHRYYPHGTGHWLGMDVHDIGYYYENKVENAKKLAPGMVFTVEPGLYFPLDDNSVSPKLRGIGVRIEDDIVITPQGNKVLTSGVPKESDEIETLCNQDS